MGTFFSNQNNRKQLKSNSVSAQYLSYFQLQRLSPQLVKQLSLRRPYQRLFYQHKKKVQKMPLPSGLFQGYLNENQKPFALGKIYYDNGSLVIGKFKDGQLVGPYHAFTTDGSYFYGSATQINEKKGTIYYPDGTLQQGYFKNDFLQGFGAQKTLKYSFQGQFLKGKPVKGKLRWYEGNRTHSYEGSFDQNGKFTGEGRLIEPSGIYTGSFKYGLKNGNGRYEFNNGLMYQGQYHNGIKQGQGNLYNSDSSLCYVGHFEHNLPSGKGSSMNIKGRKVQSEFHQGLSKRQLDMISVLASIDSGENSSK